MSLTAAEVVYAKKLLARGERRWRHWAMVRWLVLVVGVGLLWAGAWMVRIGQRVPEAPPGVQAVKTEAVFHGSVETEIAQVRTEMMAFAISTSVLTALGVGLLATGVVTMGYGLTHWNSHLRDGLLCKAIREKFHEELAVEKTAAA